ncbi:hypothetical protein Leryth_009354 [Lithospermum erythrorhizon]|nr:hypothetical protein Leryth_009354 [Lithospermum erythrorhizon]
MSSFFGGSDPFDDPFFTRPFGGMFESNGFGPGGSPFMGTHPGNPFMGAHPGNPFLGARPSGFIDHQPPQPSRPMRGPVIEELNSDDEKEETELNNGNKESSRKHGRSSQEQFVEDPDDEIQGRRSKLMHLPSDFNRPIAMSSQPRGQSISFQSSTVSYGGANGTYYTSSNVRRTGSDGLTFEESKEANSATGQAKHRVSRGVNEKGHSVMRKLDSEGRVETMQMLHNLEEDEMSGFEKDWEGAAKKHLPGVRDFNSSIMGAGNRGGGLALPSTSSSSGGTGAHVTEAAGASRLQNQGNLRRGASNGAGPSRSRPREGGATVRN